MNAKYATITPVNINWNQEIEYLLSLLERSEPKVQEAIEHLRAISQKNEMLSSSNRVLVMDDNRDLLDLLQEILAANGYEVICVSHGDAVLEQLEKHSKYYFHAIILDVVVVGGRGGLSILSEIKAIQPNIMVILSSGHPTETELLQKKHCDALLQKPYRIHEVLGLLEEGCKITRQRYYQLN